MGRRTYQSDHGESTWDPRVCTKEEEKGWIECRDDRGQTYYYNARTQETSWNIPIDQNSARALYESIEETEDHRTDRVESDEGYLDVQRGAQSKVTIIS